MLQTKISFDPGVWKDLMWAIMQHTELYTSHRHSWEEAYSTNLEIWIPCYTETMVVWINID